MASSDLQIVRVLFQALTAGDRRKMDAMSNDAPTGGGARDLRFSPTDRFLPFFERMLPEVVRERRGSTEVETYRGPVVWDVNGEQRSGVMTVWPPTDARSNECRIVRVNQFGFSGLVREDPAGGESIFMLFQQKNDVVRVYFTTETSLKAEDWNSAIKSFATYWLDAGRRSARSAFLDFETNEQFPDD